MEYLTDIMKPEDWEQVRSIYMEGIATGNSTFEADAPDWGKWDCTHLQEHRLVVRVGDNIVAWAALSPVSSRFIYSGVAETEYLRGGQAQGQRHGVSPAEGNHMFSRKGWAMDSARRHLSREYTKPQPREKAWIQGDRKA